MSQAAIEHFTKIAAPAPVGGGGRWGWLGPAVSGLIGSGAGYALHSDPNDPRAGITAAISGGVGGVLGNRMGQGKPLANRLGYTAATVAAADLLGPTALNLARAGRNNLNASTAKMEAETAALKNPPVTEPAPAATATTAPAAATPPATQDSKTTLGLTPGTMLGLGALGIGGGLALSKLLGRGESSSGSPIVMTSGGEGAAAPAALPEGAAAPAAGGPAAQGLGTLRVTLPTRKPGDNETVVEMPLEQIKLPNTLIQKLRRDTKRKIRSESAGRTYRMHINPDAKEAAWTDVAAGVGAGVGFGALSMGLMNWLKPKPKPEEGPESVGSKVIRHGVPIATTLAVGPLLGKTWGSLTHPSTN